MEQHAGAIVEKAVRRSGISIAELARRIDVNRRSVYNWFELKVLSLEVIAKIGYAIAYDFSDEFPGLLQNQKYIQMKEIADINMDFLEDSNFWKNKYIALLEKYNELLIKQQTVSEDSAA